MAACVLLLTMAAVVNIVMGGSVVLDGVAVGALAVTFDVGAWKWLPTAGERERLFAVFRAANP